MDVDWAIIQMGMYRNLLEEADGNGARKLSGTVGRELDQHLHTVQQIAVACGRESMAASLWAKPMSGGPGRYTRSALTACDVIIGTLRGSAEIARHLAPTAPQLSADALHPWVWQQAASLWTTGHRRQAVQSAATLVNAETQNKVGRRDISDSDLMNQIFSKDPASTGKPRLRWPGDSTDLRVQSMNNGLRGYASGVFQTIRNASTHETDELPEQVALEQLAALSLLARWIENCVLVESESASATRTGNATSPR